MKNSFNVKALLMLATYGVVLNTLMEPTALALSPSLSVSEDFEVQGHRGARAMRPENTIPAFLYALEVGVDTLELDVGITRDGHVVVLHDQAVNQRICESTELSAMQAQKWVHQLTLKQLKTFDCGAKRHPDFANQQLIPNTQIPTLAEVFSAVAASNAPNKETILFNIETKSSPHNLAAQPDPKEFIQVLLDAINEYDVAARVTIQSFDHRTLVEAYYQAPNIRRAVLFRDKPENWVEAAKQAHADIILPRGNLISASSVQLMQQAGFKVIPWTANTLIHWQALILMGVDGIITDDPEPLLKLLGRR